MWHNFMNIAIHACMYVLYAVCMAMLSKYVHLYIRDSLHTALSLCSARAGQDRGTGILFG